MASKLPEMQYRHLGRTGLKVSVISIGSWLTYGGSEPDEAAFECLKAAWDAGINFFDCAEVYSEGEASKVMGKAIKKFGWQREDIVITTKLYWGQAGSANPINRKGLSRKHVVEGMNAELKRLQLDYVDVVFCHRPDRDTPMEETVRAFNHLMDQGKVFYWGTSEWTAEEIAHANAVAQRLNLVGPVVEQPQYNMLAREKVEKEFEFLYEHYGTGLTIWSPLKLGILTGKYDDSVPQDSRLAKNADFFDRTYKQDDRTKHIEITKKLKPIADKLKIDRAELAYAWVVRNPHVSTCIIGATKIDHVTAAVKSLAHVDKLTDEVMKEIDEVLGNKPEPSIRRF